MEHLYIYYQLRPEHHARLHALVLQMQSRLADASGQSGRLLRRTELGASGTETWMEIYENVSVQTAALLEDLCVELGLAELLEGGRHVERFVDL